MKTIFDGRSGITLNEFMKPECRNYEGIPQDFGKVYQLTLELKILIKRSSSPPTQTSTEVASPTNLLANVAGFDIHDIIARLQSLV